MRWTIDNPVGGGQDRMREGSPSRRVGLGMISPPSACEPSPKPAASGIVVGALAVAALALAPSLALAQAAGDRSDPGVDADDARTDALLGTLNLATPQPYGNLYSTAPGAEQQPVRPQFRFNFLAPLNFDSNAEEVSSGGTQTWGIFPVGNLSWAAPVADLPFRVSVSARSEFKRFLVSHRPSADPPFDETLEAAAAGVDCAGHRQRGRSLLGAAEPVF